MKISESLALQMLVYQLSISFNLSRNGKYNFCSADPMVTHGWNTEVIKKMGYLEQTEKWT